jgi:hypothetical protein
MVLSLLKEDIAAAAQVLQRSAALASPPAKPLVAAVLAIVEHSWDEAVSDLYWHHLSVAAEIMEIVGHACSQFGDIRGQKRAVQVFVRLRCLSSVGLSTADNGAFLTRRGLNALRRRIATEKHALEEGIVPLQEPNGVVLMKETAKRAQIILDYVESRRLAAAPRPKAKKGGAA